jgi:hypothetical protein
MEKAIAGGFVEKLKLFAREPFADCFLVLFSQDGPANNEAAANLLSTFLFFFLWRITFLN